MGSQKTKTKSQETATTTPNLPGAAAPAVNSYFNNVSNLLASGQPLGAPANDLQRSLFSAGMNMVGQTGANTLQPATNGIQNAMGMLGNIGPAAVSQASAPGAYTPVSATAQSAALPGAYTPSQATTATYGNIAQAQAPTLPGVATYDVTDIAGGITGGGYQGARAIDYMDAYRNPYQQQVIDATIADLNNSQGADRAAYARRGGMMGAFGGSRFGLGETNLIDAQGRTRNSAISGLLSQGWRDTLAAGQGDASNANSAGIASMQSSTQAGIARAGLLADARRANTDATNEMGRLGYSTNAELSRFNAGQTNDASRAIFDQTNETNRYNTGQTNDAAKTVYQTTADNTQFNADQANQTGRFNADQTNNALNTQYTTTADTNRFNTGEANDAAQFNANLGVDTAQAYGNLSNSLGGLLNNGAQLDINRMGALGDVADRQQIMDLANSPYGQQLMAAGLLNPENLLALTSGQTINSSGTSTQRQSGGLASSLLGGAFGLGSAYLGR